MSKVITLQGIASRIHKGKAVCKNIGIARIKSLGDEDYKVCLDNVQEDAIGVLTPEDQRRVDAAKEATVIVPLDSLNVPYAVPKIPKKRGRPKGIYGKERRKRQPDAKAYTKPAIPMKLRKSCDLKTAYYSQIEKGKFRGQYRCKCNTQGDTDVAPGNYRLLDSAICERNGAIKSSSESEKHKAKQKVATAKRKEILRKAKEERKRLRALRKTK